MPSADPELRRAWLFSPGANTLAHDAMERSGADALIVDFEDITPPGRREEARRELHGLEQRWREAGRNAAVRINAPYTITDTDSAVREALCARRLTSHELSDRIPACSG